MYSKDLNYLKILVMFNISDVAFYLSKYNITGLQNNNLSVTYILCGDFKSANNVCLGCAVFV